MAGSRTAAPHDEQRVEISGCMELLPVADCQLPISKCGITGSHFDLILSIIGSITNLLATALNLKNSTNRQLEVANRQCSDTMHCIEQVFPLGIDMDAKFLALRAESILKLSY
jgi:hypothetical protein